MDHPLVARTLTVTRLEALSPRMVRVTLAGDELHGFETASPTDHVRVFFPAGNEPPQMPTVVDGRPQMRDSMDPNRNYTVRAYRRQPGEIDIDIVLHGDGVAVAWVARARTGDRLGIMGPRSSTPVPLDRSWYLFAVDATGLPAAERWLAELPACVDVTMMALVVDAAEERPLATAADLDVRWLAGSAPSLGEAVRNFDLPTGPGFVWIAGETDEIAPLRPYLRDERGLADDSLAVDGYWRRAPAPDHGRHEPPG